MESSGKGPGRPRGAAGSPAAALLALLAISAVACGPQGPAPPAPRSSAPALPAPQASSSAATAAGAVEPEILVDLLDNGDFSLPPDPAIRGIPYWRVLAGAPSVETFARGPDGVRSAELRTGRGQAVEQPLAFDRERWRGLAILGQVRGRGLLEVRDGQGGAARFPLDGGEEGLYFAIRGEDLERSLGRPPVPRLLLRFAGDPSAPEADATGARWSGLSARVPLACPSEEALEAEVRAELSWMFARWRELALDDVGPRRTAFLAREFDALTGETLRVLPSSPSVDSFAAQLLEAWEATGDPEWAAALEAYLRDLFELGLHPETGLPRSWDPSADRPLDANAVEVMLPLRFLIDLAERGPEAWRARALEAARRIGEQVLARGILPDGAIAAAYRPADGQPMNAVVDLRRLDVPAQLVRLVALERDPRALEAAREALLAFDYTHHWPGTWDRIDPGFDDQFGHYGDRAAAMWRAAPEEPSFRHLALSGWKKYGPLWRGALRYGGNVAADQVRCWRIAARMAELEPELLPEVRGLLSEAVRVHFKGMQDSGGAWRDVTIVRFDPVTNLPVGDTGGVPQNLLEGLALCYDGRLGMRDAEHRAMFAAVLRSSRAAYRGEHGYLSGARRASGEGARNSGFGSGRMWSGLVDMLRQLAGP